MLVVVLGGVEEGTMTQSKALQGDPCIEKTEDHIMMSITDIGNLRHTTIDTTCPIVQSVLDPLKIDIVIINNHTHQDITTNVKESCENGKSNGTGQEI